MVVILLIGCFICALLLLLTIKVEFIGLIRGPKYVLVVLSRTEYEVVLGFIPM